MTQFYNKGFTCLFCVLLLALTVPSAAQADSSGVFGRVAWRGELVPDVVIWAYEDGSGDFTAGEVARSEPTAADGTYRMELEPGRYTLVARGYKGGYRGVHSENHPGRPQEGDYFCFYSGSPVVVPKEGWVPVGFNLVRVNAEERSRSEKSSIEGVITYRDDPLEKVYLYLYEESAESFRGPGMATLPVGTGGRFRASVSPGTYYLIARKRVRGGMYGPMEIGDYFNYYPGNPVVVGADENVKLVLETVNRISQLEEGENNIPVISGLVVGSDGAPVRGVRVFAYPEGETTGRPLFFSDASDPDGRFSFSIPTSGMYSLLARQRFGGPAVSGEYYGLFEEGKSIRVEDSGTDMEITVQVRKQR